MPEKTPINDFLARRMDIDACQKEIAAKEQEEKSIAERITGPFGSVISVNKFGDRLSAGYRVSCNIPDREFWIWGADRPMNKAEVENHFLQQMADHLAYLR